MGTIGEQSRMVRGDLECGVVARERLMRPIEPEQGVAAIAERVDVAGIARQHKVETRERRLWPAQRKQRDAPLVERLGVAGDDSQGIVIVCQRPIERSALMMEQSEQMQRVEVY